MVNYQAVYIKSIAEIINSKGKNEIISVREIRNILNIPGRNKKIINLITKSLIYLNANGSIIELKDYSPKEYIIIKKIKIKKIMKNTILYE